MEAPKNKFDILKLANNNHSSNNMGSDFDLKSAASLLPDIDDKDETITRFGKSSEDHNKNLVRVFQRLREVNLKLNPTKCEFLKKELLYLGHVISAEGVSPDPEKIRGLKEYPVPKNADEVKRFVAFANYYPRFVFNFAKIALPNFTLIHPSFKNFFILSVWASSLALSGSRFQRSRERSSRMPIFCQQEGILTSRRC